MKKILFTDLGIKAILFIIILIITIIVYCVKKKNEKTQYKRKKIIDIIIFLAIIFYTLLYFPFDRIIYFKTVDDAFNFQHPEGKLLKKKIYKDTAFGYGAGVCDRKSLSCVPDVFTIYTRKNKRWHVQKSYIGSDKDTKYLYSKKGNIYLIKVLESKKDNITGIFIWDQNYGDKPNLTNDTTIEDSNNTNFELFDYNKSKYETIVFLGIVHGEIDEDYSIMIDGERFTYNDIGSLFSTLQKIERKDK